MGADAAPIVPTTMQRPRGSHRYSRVFSTLTATARKKTRGRLQANPGGYIHLYQGESRSGGESAIPGSGQRSQLAQVSIANNRVPNGW